MTQANQSNTTIAAEAERTFWEKVVELRPGLKTCYLHPAVARIMTGIMALTVESLIDSNPAPAPVAESPTNLALGWNQWHSGGGCMIWSLELPDGRSAHIGSDLLILSSLGCKAHLDAEAEDIDMPHHLLVADLPCGDLKEKLLTFLGEDLAEKIAADAAVIYPAETAE